MSCEHRYIGGMYTKELTIMQLVVANTIHVKMDDMYTHLYTDGYLHDLFSLGNNPVASQNYSITN